MPHHYRISSLIGLIIISLLNGLMADRIESLHDLDYPEHLKIKGKHDFPKAGPSGERVLHTRDKIDVRVDLKNIQLNAHEYDLIKIDVKSDDHALLVISLENYPKPGWLANWYPLDIVRKGTGWRTFDIDLKRPEEMYAVGKSGGMAKNKPNLRGVRIKASVHDTKRSMQSKGRSIYLKNIRFVKKLIHLDWDQSRAPYEWKKGEALSFHYPLELTNLTQKAQVVELLLKPFQVEHAIAKLQVDRVKLKAGEKRMVTATISLPNEIAQSKKPLYCERFEAYAQVKGQKDSSVTLMRSSDPIHLSVTVPIPEEQLTWPLIRKRSDIPERVSGFDAVNKNIALRQAEAARVESLRACMNGPLQVRFTNFGFNVDSTMDKHLHELKENYERGLSACAMLYQNEGKKKYLDKGTRMLLEMSQVFPERLKQYRDSEINLISHGIIAQFTLSLGWTLGGDRPAYSMSTRYSNGFYNDFDIFSKDMSAENRKKIIAGFIEPAAIQMRNHLIGLNNMQNVVNYAIMYAGIAARNWPLVSFAFSSEHGLLNQIKFGFDDQGLCNEGHYQFATLNPILWSAELLFHRGIDIYDQRLYDILFSRSAKAIGMDYKHPIRDYLSSHRFSQQNVTRHKKTTGGFHQDGGTTLLSWKGLQLAMNWNTHIFRGASDRCNLKFMVQPNHPLASLARVGEGTYTHSSLGQSIIIVDEKLQNTKGAQVMGYDIDGQVQYVQATSSDHYPGSRITRTFAILGDHALNVDHVENQKAAKVDWCLKGVGRDLSIPMKRLEGSFTQKPDQPHKGVSYGAGLPHHHLGTSRDNWSEGKGRMTMLGGTPTKVITFPTHPGTITTMARREKVKSTDYVAFFSTRTESIKRLKTQRNDGSPAKATAVEITLDDGTSFRVLVNFESAGTEVHCQGLRTKDRFTTDFASIKKTTAVLVQP